MTDRDEQICALHAQGLPLREIGRRLGVSHQAVKKRLVRLRVVTAPVTQQELHPAGEDSETLTRQREALAGVLQRIRAIGTELSRSWSCQPSVIRAQGDTIASLAEQGLQRLRKG